MFQEIVTDDVDSRQNKEVTDSTVALFRGLYMQQTLHPVCWCERSTVLLVDMLLCLEPPKVEHVRPGTTSQDIRNFFATIETKHAILPLL